MRQLLALSAGMVMTATALADVTITSQSRSLHAQVGAAHTSPTNATDDEAFAEGGEWIGSVAATVSVPSHSGQTWWPSNTFASQQSVITPSEIRFVTTLGNNPQGLQYIVPPNGSANSRLTVTFTTTESIDYAGTIGPYASWPVVIQMRIRDTSGTVVANFANVDQWDGVLAVGDYTLEIESSFFGSAVGVGGVVRLILGGPFGACCNGSACTLSDANGCTGPQSAWAGAGAACNAAGNSITPCCRADFNKTNGVSVQDLFDFLGAYFVGNMAADVSGEGLLGVQDVFSYLAAFFGPSCD